MSLSVEEMPPPVMDLASERRETRLDALHACGHVAAFRSGDDLVEWDVALGDVERIQWIAVNEP